MAGPMVHVSFDLLGFALILGALMCLAAGGAVLLAWLWRRRSAGSSRARHVQLTNDLSAFLEVLPEGLLLSDVGGHVLWSNARARALLGLGNASDVGAHLLSLVQHAFQSRQAELHELHPAASMTLQIRLLPLDLGSPGRNQVGAVVLDSSEQRQQEALYRNLVGNVWHELKTPLVIMAMHVNQLRQLPAEDDQARAASLDIMEAEVERLTSLTSNILLISRLESEEPLHLESTNMGALVEQEVVRLMELSEQKGMQLSLQSAPALPRIAVDRAWMRQVFANLIGNVIKHCPARTCIEVRLSSDSSGLAIQVADNGQGIAQEDLPHLFEKMYHIQKEGSRSTRGSGLGLSIVKAIVRRHGGDITVESALGKGTIFTVRLPVVP